MRKFLIYSVLPIPVEEISKLNTKVDNFTVIKKEALLVLKQKAYEARKVSIKGQKDRIDLISLIILPDFDFDLYKNLLKTYYLEKFKEQIEDLIMQTKEVFELDLNQHHFSKIKGDLIKKLEW